MHRGTRSCPYATAGQTTDHGTDESHQAALQYLRSRIKGML
jgi:hypothetical protein